MAGKDLTITYQGQNVLLDISFYNYAGGSLVDDDSFTSGVYPSGYIYNPSNSCVSSGNGTRISQGKYYYSYDVPSDAPLGNNWAIHWKITINNIPNTFSEFFTVLPIGADNYLALIEEVRFYMGDDATPYIYTDEKVGKSVEKALPLINDRLNWSCVYVSGSISPSPTDFQREIYSLQAARLIMHEKLWTLAQKGLKIRDGETSIDISAASASANDAIKYLDGELEKRINSYLMNQPGHLVY
jgi:hypothetical protein